jgi:hypothetical protein
LRNNDDNATTSAIPTTPIALSVTPPLVEISDDSDDDTVPILESTAGTAGNSRNSTSTGNSSLSLDVDVSDPSDELNIDLLDEDVRDIASISTSRNTGNSDLVGQRETSDNERRTFPCPPMRNWNDEELVMDPLSEDTLEDEGTRLNTPPLPTWNSLFDPKNTRRRLRRHETTNETSRPFRFSPPFNPENDDTDESDVEIVCTLKPRHERTPEVIDVIESDEEENVDIEDREETVGLDQPKEEDDEEQNDHNREAVTFNESLMFKEEVAQSSSHLSSRPAMSSVIICPTPSSSTNQQQDLRYDEGESKVAQREAGPSSVKMTSRNVPRPFQCDVCRNRYSTRGSLAVHKERHQRENRIQNLQLGSESASSEQQSLTASESEQVVEEKEEENSTSNSSRLKSIVVVKKTGSSSRSSFD